VTDEAARGCLADEIGSSGSIIMMIIIQRKFVLEHSNNTTTIIDLAILQRRVD
jgi:hypothetical protein